MSSYSEVEMEQGELSASPDLQDSPGVRLDEEESEDQEEEVEQDAEDRSSRRHEGDEDEDILDIKPPQTHAGRNKEKRKHSKHRDERKRDRESARDRNEDRGSTRSRDRSKDRYKEESSKDPKSRGPKPVKDREMEDKRREKSRRERERLERLERERYRLEREAAREHQERLRAAEREKDRERAERHRRKEEAAAHDARRRIQGEHRRDRSRDKHGSREKSRSPIPKHSSRDKERSRRHEDDDRRRYRHDSEDHDHNRDIKEHEDDRMEEPEPPPPHKKEEEDIHSPSAEEERSEEDSASETEQSQSERSEHQEQSEEEEEEEGRSDVEPEAPRRSSTGKFRSKFDDDRSPEDTDKDSMQDGEIEEHYLDQTPPQSPIELKPELPPYYPALQGCRNVEEFHCLNKIEEGTYGVVFRARDKKADEIVALKKLKMEKEKEGFPITSLREINTLLKAQHPNIVTVREIVVGSNIDKIYIVMDYVEHDLKSLMETMREPFMIGEVKTLMMQLLRGVNHLHDNWIIHRDLKTSNLLLSHKGVLKIGDFGLAREYGSPLKQYTPIVVTLWYRAPELLLGCKEYSTAIDLWSVGCIFAELLTRKPLFPGKSELDELNRIFKDLGTPNERIWPGMSELPGMKKCTFAEHPYNQLRNRFGSSLSDKGFDLMNRFLTYDPTRRIIASEGVKHEYFAQEPKPVPPSMFPTWPAKSEMPRRTHGNSPKPPSGGKAYSKLLGDDDIGFHLASATKGAAAVGQGFSLKF